MNKEKAVRGAKIIIENWVNLKKGDKLLIVTNTPHLNECEILLNCALEKGAAAEIMTADTDGKLVGIYFDDNPHMFLDYDIIIGATDYSLVTTLAAKNAISKGRKFLSLPLHTNDGSSLLEYDFLLMDVQKSKIWANILINNLSKAKKLRVKTLLGTDLTFCKKDRPAKFFNGNLDSCGGYSSASIEVYIPIEEDKTEGKLVLDGSMGYIGAVEETFDVTLKNGRIEHISECEQGEILSEFIREYEDENMYTASEFGIGLNCLSKCRGKCYIEDESALGTFHIGFGRNLALGGNLQAKGHYDLVSYSPTIWADEVKIMDNGQIIF